jgi:hypothetical protein
MQATLYWRLIVKQHKYFYIINFKLFLIFFPLKKIDTINEVINPEIRKIKNPENQLCFCPTEEC